MIINEYLASFRLPAFYGGLAHNIARTRPQLVVEGVSEGARRGTLPP